MRFLYFKKYMEFSTQSILVLLSIGGAGAVLSRFLDTQEWFTAMKASDKATTVAILSGVLGIISTILLSLVPQDVLASVDNFVKPYLPSISILLPTILSFLSTQISYALNRFGKSFSEIEEIKVTE